MILEVPFNAGHSRCLCLYEYFLHSWEDESKPMARPWLAAGQWSKHVFQVSRQRCSSCRDLRGHRHNLLGRTLNIPETGGCGCSVPGGVQGQVGWGPGQPGLVLDMELGSPA